MKFIVTMITDYLKRRCKTLIVTRNVKFHAPSFDQIGSFDVAYQTWRTFSEFCATPVAERDRYFGDRFAGNSKTLRLQIVTDEISDVTPVKDSKCILIGRSRRTLLNPVRTLVTIIKDLRQILTVVTTRMEGLSARSRLGLLFVATQINNERSSQSYKIYSDFKAWLKNARLANKELVLPYEAQPEQSALACAWQEAGGLVIGYLHSTMLNFPSLYVRPVIGAPNSLWAHGSAYIAVLIKLGWDSKQIQLIESLRYGKDSSLNLSSGTVVMPYSDADFGYAFKVLDQICEIESLQLSSVRPHPRTGISDQARRTLDRILTKHDRPVDAKKAAIFVIGPSTMPLEILESGTPHRMIHIPLSPSFVDRFDHGIWKEDIEYRSISGGCEMRLKNKGAFIRFGNRET